MKHIFIINPKAGKENASVRIRTYLKTRQDIESLVFNSEYQGHETELVNRLCNIFDDEPVRFYACGGSGTLCRMLCGITNFEMAEVACYPCGMTNDFLKVYEGEANAFRDLDALIDGVQTRVDIFDFGFGRAINTTSSGYEAKVSADVNSLANLSIVGQKLPYYMGIGKNLLTKINTPFKVKIDGETFDDNYTIVSALNGICYGGTFQPLPNLCPSSGDMAVVLYKSPSITTMAKAMRYYKVGNLEPLSQYLRVFYAKELEVEVPENITHYFAVDGEVFDMLPYNNRYTLRLLPSALRWIIPRNVKLKEQCRGGKTNASGI